MNLHIEPLDPIEAPLSNQFWIGFPVGMAVVFVVMLLARAMSKRG